MENEFSDLRLKALRLVVTLSEAMEDHERSAFIRDLAALVMGRSANPVRKAGVTSLNPTPGLTDEEYELVRRLSDATDRLSGLGGTGGRY
ncbi:MAG: hypothetical protein LW707_01045 [Sphingobacteriales bacterium]|jgi:hypothetical protein|nr:hypothetical protein [Sphingobacteriales bacterium]